MTGCSAIAVAVVISTSSPRLITAMRSQRWAMTARSWLTISRVSPCSRRSRREQVEDFRLHRDVERRGRLVEQQDARLQDQGAGDGHALALAARKLVRIAVAVLAAEARPRASAWTMRASPRSSRWIATGMARIWSTVWLGCSEP